MTYRPDGEERPEGIAPGEEVLEETIWAEEEDWILLAALALCDDP